jgi:hypothetical protein
MKLTAGGNHILGVPKVNVIESLRWPHLSMVLVQLGVCRGNGSLHDHTVHLFGGWRAGHIRQRLGSGIWLVWRARMDHSQLQK